MNWARMLVMGDVGQQIDIESVESDVSRLRANVHVQHQVDRSQDKQLQIVRREVDELKVLVAELTRLLVAGGTVPREAVERIARALDAPQPDK